MKLHAKSSRRRFLARGVGRPVWLGRSRNETFFASTEAALEVVEHYLQIRLRKEELPEGTLLAIEHTRHRGAVLAGQHGPALGLHRARRSFLPFFVWRAT